MLRFFVLGKGDIKYTYNNGLMASDPQLATSNFLNTLYKIPSLLEKEQLKLQENEKHISTVKQVVNSQWTKENDLRDLRLEFEKLDRKIKNSISQSDNKEEEIAESIVGEEQKTKAFKSVF